MLLLFYQQNAGHRRTTTSGQMCTADLMLQPNQTQNMHDPGTMTKQFHCMIVLMTFGYRMSGRDAVQTHFGQSLMTSHCLNTGCCKHGPIGCGHRCSPNPMTKTRMHDPTSQPNSSLHPQADGSTADQQFDHSQCLLWWPLLQQPRDDNPEETQSQFESCQWRTKTCDCHMDGQAECSQSSTVSHRCQCDEMSPTLDHQLSLSVHFEDTPHRQMMMHICTHQQHRPVEHAVAHRLESPLDLNAASLQDAPETNSITSNALLFLTTLSRWCI